MTYYSRKRADEIDKEILEKGSPERTDGFDDMISPLIEDMSAQMQAIADQKKLSLGSNFPDEAEANSKAESDDLAEESEAEEYLEGLDLDDPDLELDIDSDYSDLNIEEEDEIDIEDISGDFDDDDDDFFIPDTDSPEHIEAKEQAKKELEAQSAKENNDGD